jgi:hypothetical protein
MDAFRQQIDKEIRALKTRRNTLASISCLTTELLAKIFITVAYSCYDSSNGTDLSWIYAVTAVCSHWRDIALECPGLWCFIGFKHPIWTEEMLKRSKVAPLIIRANEGKFMPKITGSLHLALQNISRIRELHLEIRKVVMEELFDRIKKCAAPLLRSLCLSNTSYTHQASDGYTLPETLFVGDDHHLERLELFDCIISWDSPLLCDLVHLTLHNTCGMIPPTLMQLLGALEKMPLIETLDLDGGLPVVPDDDNFSLLETKHIVHLSNLATLRLSSTAVECAYLLNHLSYPTSTSLGLVCAPNTLNIKTNSLSILFDAISSVRNGRDAGELLRCLLIKSWFANSTILQGWAASGRGADEYPPSESPQIDIYLESTQAEEVLVDVCRALTLTNLRVLSVFPSKPTPKATWSSVFGNLASLRTVHVSGPSAIEFVSALSTGLEENISEECLSIDDTRGVFLPNLHELWLDDKAFNGTPTYYINFFEDLRDCLMARCHWNAEVRKLRLECSRRHYAQVELLKEIVVDVDWNV